ncbi:MAG: antibiotic biosynthesis monooxygenase [Deltaproteobacteria bacterium]|nr:antibiotic biosynthesis monooxygenase [Deltaproteobacteria bacterium]
MAEVTVIAQIKTKEGMEEKVGKELLKLVVPTRSEQGCIVYNLHQSAESKSLFMFYECWKRASGRSFLPSACEDTNQVSKLRV